MSETEKSFTEHFVEFKRVVFEIRERTDRQTSKHTDKILFHTPAGSEVITTHVTNRQKNRRTGRITMAYTCTALAIPPRGKLESPHSRLHRPI